MRQTVIGIFDYGVDAQMAAQELEKNGIPSSSIDIAVRGARDKTGAPNQNKPNPTHPGASASTNTAGGNINSQKDNDFFNSLFDNRDESSKYYEAARQGSIVTVHTNSSDQAKKAAELLDKCGAVDVDERTAQNRGMAGSSKGNWTGAGSKSSIPIVEEKMQVGKREVETGGVRMRSRIIERPVEEKLRLREEHVNVERRPVNRPASERDFASFKEGETTISERAEVPIVNKEARVVEEVRLNKNVEQHDETVRGTERKTDVEIDRMNPKNEGKDLNRRDQGNDPNRKL
ncbi:YsnF/AvaK domain-containing protein [uncultured Pontibacter sp.]|uniref:YsnF/AvaK domain-containing protein n=1 Tax=uncultured Pontibacter sp. TaxID=453356 RepID=UPI00261F8534|nr:YsnF/AvaK domain-containing protein [uncultured Pontibacter sp.]